MITIERDTTFFVPIETRWHWDTESTDMPMPSRDLVEVRWSDIIPILVSIPQEVYTDELIGFIRLDGFISFIVGHERWARLPDQVLYKRQGGFNAKGKRIEARILIDPEFRGWKFGSPQGD